MIGMRRTGTVNRPQDNLIAINQMCMMRGTIHHEFLHTLGFSHEHVRHDRDQYIKFNEEGFDHEQCEFWRYDKLSPREVVDLGTPYDLKSILHYPGRACWLGEPYDFILTSKIDIDLIVGYTFDSMSPIDELEVNRFYSCPDQEIVQCRTSSDFYLAHQRCDGIDHCDDGSDEAECPLDCAHQILFRGEQYIYRIEPVESYQHVEKHLWLCKIESGWALVDNESCDVSCGVFMYSTDPARCPEKIHKTSWHIAIDGKWQSLKASIKADFDSPCDLTECSENEICVESEIFLGRESKCVCLEAFTSSDGVCNPPDVIEITIMTKDHNIVPLKKFQRLHEDSFLQYYSAEDDLNLYYTLYGWIISPSPKPDSSLTEFTDEINIFAVFFGAKDSSPFGYFDTCHYFGKNYDLLEQHKFDPTNYNCDYIRIGTEGTKTTSAVTSSTQTISTRPMTTLSTTPTSTTSKTTTATTTATSSTTTASTTSTSTSTPTTTSSTSTTSSTTTSTTTTTTTTTSTTTTTTTTSTTSTTTTTTTTTTTSTSTTTTTETTTSNLDSYLYPDDIFFIIEAVITEISTVKHPNKNKPLFKSFTAKKLK